MNVARCWTSAAVSNGYIYVAGGLKTYEPNRPGRTVDAELYDPVNDDWLQVAPMNEPRVKFGLFKSKMFLYAIGKTSTVERCDLQRPRWTKVCFSFYRIHKEKLFVKQMTFESSFPRCCRSMEMLMSRARWKLTTEFSF